MENENKPYTLEVTLRFENVKNHCQISNYDLSIQHTYHEIGILQNVPISDIKIIESK